MYGHAYNCDLNSKSMAKVNLLKTPFIFDKDKQTFETFGQMAKGDIIQQKIPDTSN